MSGENIAPLIVFVTLVAASVVSLATGHSTAAMWWAVGAALMVFS